MAMQLEQRTYVRVPKNSVIHVTVKPKSGTGYHLNGRVDKGDSKKKSWSHSALKNKTVKYKFTAGGGYFVRVSSHFTGSSQAEVEIAVKVMKPDGAQHSTSWSTVLKGKNNDLSRAKITLRVRS